MTGGDVRRLTLLARLYGVQTSFHDVFGERRVAPPDAVLAVLRSLGAPVGGLGDVEDAISHRRSRRWHLLCEPAIAAWTGEHAEMLLRLQSEEIDAPLWLSIGVEGEERRWRILPHDPAGSPETLLSRIEGSSASHDGRLFALKVTLPEGLPTGYHPIRVETAGRSSDALLILAPGRAHLSRAHPERSGEVVGDDRTADGWGLFAPIYALRSSREEGIGHLGDLARLVDFVADRGGRFVSTLPFLSSAHWLPVAAAGRDYSPYNPTSRLFWDERYLDLSTTARTSGLPEGSGNLPVEATPGTDDDLPADRFVHHGAVLESRRTVLESAAQHFFATARLPEGFSEWLGGNPHAGAYARFAAAQESLGTPWSAWPREILGAGEGIIPLAGGESGRLEQGERRKRLHRYHLFVQWCLEQQLSDLAGRARERGVDLMLDLPLGVPPHAYDAWAWRASFAFDAAVGAPPDTFFRAGQNWGFAPQVPERARMEGHDYFISVVRHHLRHAGRLRMDHIMGLYRQYWIPDGFDAEQGVYVRYPVDEHLAILALEAAGHGSFLVGEDLGTVPNVVRARMRDRRVKGMYVVQSVLSVEEEAGDPEPSPWQVTMVNTHDMPPFASWWESGDLDQLEELGHLTREEAGSIRGVRAAGRDRLLRSLRERGLLGEDEGGIVAIHAACLRWLASSGSASLQVNLEDLWGESRPQNVPGTGPELPNWRGRMRFTLEEAAGMPEVDGMLRSLGRQRGERG